MDNLKKLFSNKHFLWKLERFAVLIFVITFFAFWWNERQAGKDVSPRIMVTYSIIVIAYIVLRFKYLTGQKRP